MISRKKSQTLSGAYVTPPRPAKKNTLIPCPTPLFAGAKNTSISYGNYDEIIPEILP